MQNQLVVEVDRSGSLRPNGRKCSICSTMRTFTKLPRMAESVGVKEPRVALFLKRDGDVAGIGTGSESFGRPPLKFGMAYLRWGPLWERRGVPLDPEAPAQMARAVEDEYVDKRRLFLRVLPNAFTGSPRATTMQAAFCRFAVEPLGAENTYRTFVLDLSPSLDELRKGLDPKWRNKLCGAEKNGLKIVVGNGSDEYQVFCQI